MAGSPEGIAPIDTLMTGRERVTCAYVIDAPEPLLVEAGPATSARAAAAALSEAGIGPHDLAHLVLTHIHLDHAGGAGDLALAFPSAMIWIHPGAARHLSDPGRLIASASRIYGEDGVRATFGLPRPVDAGRIRSISGGEEIHLGGRALQAVATPGHASSHLAFQDSQTGVVFTGDSVGVHLPGVNAIRPAAPPPEFDVEEAIASIRTIADRARGALLFAHFGAVGEIEATCEEAVATLRRWSERARVAVAAGRDQEAIEAGLAELARDQELALAAGDRERFEIIGSVRMNALGLSRYWRKRGPAKDPDAGTRPRQDS